MEECKTKAKEIFREFAEHDEFRCFYDQRPAMRMGSEMGPGRGTTEMFYRFDVLDEKHMLPYSVYVNVETKEGTVSENFEL